MKAKRRQTIGSQIGMDFWKESMILRIANKSKITIAG